MIRLTFTFFLLACSVVSAQEKFGPQDPIASVNGNPIYLGELNLVLVQRLRIRDLSKAPLDVQKAIAATLVRQHLALKTLRDQGGQALERLIESDIANFANESRRVGSNLAQYAKARSADENSLKASLAWQTAWNRYLKSRLTDKNLRIYFDRNRNKYAGGRWDVSQVFLEMDVKDGTSVGIAEQRMGTLIKELRESPDSEAAFAAAAREHSDAGSAADGGRIGWVEKDGDLPRSVMDVIRKSKVGFVSDPVRSPLGLHTVYVHEFKTADLAYEDLTDQADLRRDATNALFDQLVRKQKDAKIAWYISGLKPPANIKLIPE